MGEDKGIHKKVWLGNPNNHLEDQKGSERITLGCEDGSGSRLYVMLGFSIFS
jgi:hypothetical protein